MNGASSPNPFRTEGLSARRAEPCILVVFGAAGNLSRKKLLPALYQLARGGYLPSPYALVGTARRSWDHEAFRREVRGYLQAHSRIRPLHEEVWKGFSETLFFQSLDYQKPQGFEELRRFLEELETSRGLRNRLFYLAIPPELYSPLIARLGDADLVPPRARRPGWCRIIIEKPFGRDLTSARQLHRTLSGIFQEEEIFRIDHYLGKETVQNLLVLRFANGIFEPLWNQKHVDHVQITVAEDVGMEGRGAYFDPVGILRDIVQNHMMQLLCLVAMEPPTRLEADSIRNEKIKVLQAIRCILPDDVGEYTVRGQYQAGWVAGQAAPGYREEPGVALDSTTETFVALKVFLDNWRWAGVPFYLRAGKRLPKRISEIAVVFRSVPRILFNAPGIRPLKPNILAIRIQPDEGISLRIVSKIPGMGTQIQPVSMNFRYGTTFGVETPEAYERLLLDVMAGDRTLFASQEEVEAAWAFITPILHGWERQGPEGVYPYDAGTWGPPQAETLLLRDRRTWRRL